LIDPHSRIDHTPPVFRETEHFYFNLPSFAAALRAWLEQQEHWRPNVRAFSLGLIDGLKPRPITRDLDWGVPIPLAGYDDKRIYVWFDAVIGYLSASVEWATSSAAQTRGRSGGLIRHPATTTSWARTTSCSTR